MVVFVWNVYLAIWVNFKSCFFFLPFTSNVTNQSSDIEFTSYVVCLCVGDCIDRDAAYIGVFILRCLRIRIILHDLFNVFVWGAHFCEVVAYFAGIANLVVFEAVASKVWAWTEFSFRYFFTIGEGRSLLCENEFPRAFFCRQVAVFFLFFVKFTSLVSLCMSSTCYVVASAVWPAFIESSRVKSVSDRSFSWRQQSFLPIIIMRLSLTSFNSHSGLSVFNLFTKSSNFSSSSRREVRNLYRASANFFEEYTIPPWFPMQLSKILVLTSFDFCNFSVTNR